MQEASATAILSLLDALPQEREEDEHYDYFYRLLLNLRQTARTVFDITAEEETQLLQIAHSRTATAYKAQTLLFIARGHEFVVNLPELDYNRQTAFKTQPHTAALQGEAYLVSGFYPNPASHAVQLNYNLTPTNNIPDKATIQMYNILGKPIFTATISGAGIYTLPLENFAEGLYYYVIVQTDNHKVLKDGKLLIAK
ncbi:MAG TPA: T9SS type A sorting domain-containing protein [Chitinophagales bacterium]|nr:T9SS type A sorting domain-containing protein [Chitinophagales bacterium]HRK28930.1 T9SS type A sorting domain-containing protein [Chitinophagales bacterium]